MMNIDATTGLPRDLDDGIYGALIYMDNRDIRKAWQAAQAYLGEDRLAIQVQQEFNALSMKEQEELRQKGLGRYGIINLVTKPEVALALIVVAREINPTFNFPGRTKESLEEPDIAAKVTERFPAITAERIEMALK